MSQTKPANYPGDIVLRPRSKWLRFDWVEFWRYRDLLGLLVWRDIVARYQQTFLGRAWFFLQPVIMTLVFALVFGIGISVPTQGVPRILFYFCGLLPWIYFSDSLLSASSSLLSHADMFRKIYFPRLIVPIAAVLSRLFGFTVHLLIFLLVYAGYKFFSPAGNSLIFGALWWLLPVAFCQTVALSLAMGLWIAALSVNQRDLQHVAPFLIQIWMFVSPVIYPAALVPEKWQMLYLLNPMVWVIELYRHAFLGISSQALNPVFILISLGVTATLLATGFIAFNRAQRTLVDTL